MLPNPVQSTRPPGTSGLGSLTASILFMLCAAVPCVSTAEESPSVTQQGKNEDDPYRQKRLRMVEEQIASRGVRDPLVLEALRKVPRHRFVPESARDLAYHDGPLPIGNRQTISQPYIVAAMTEFAEIGPESRVLEIGTGSGYQAAVLAEIAKEVYSIEIVEALAKRAEETLDALGYESVHVRHGDGYRGWPDAAPFDAILITAAPPAVPEPLLAQLREGGNLIVPVGSFMQSLERHTRTADGIRVETLFPVRFVPMTGEAQSDRLRSVKP